MNWDAIGAVSEGLGALAVFVTLVYLAIQVNQTRREVRRAANRARTDAARQHNLMFALDERWTRAYTKASVNLLEATGKERSPDAFGRELVSTGGLTMEEAAAVERGLLATWLLQTQIIEDIDQLSDGQRKEVLRFIRIAYDGTYPISQLWYQQRKQTLNPDLVNRIDELLVQPA